MPARACVQLSDGTFHLELNIQRIHYRLVTHCFEVQVSMGSVSDVLNDEIQHMT